MFYDLAGPYIEVIYLKPPTVQTKDLHVYVMTDASLRLDPLLTYQTLINLFPFS